jgi:uncharacterized protein YjbJ (UPF0337 family)
LFQKWVGDAVGQGLPASVWVERFGEAAAGILQVRRDAAAPDVGGAAMGDDKVKGKVDQVTGKIKEGVGGATGDESLEQEGKTDQAKGHLKEGVGKLKDAVHDAGR